MKLVESLQDIQIEGYSLAAAAVFHTKAGYENTVAVICCKHFDNIENHARPNITGTLLLLDTSSDQIIASLQSKSASTEVLKLTRDGRFILTRINEDRCLAVLDSTQLIILKTISHDFNLFPPNHYSLTILYTLFPVLSKSDTRLVLLDWNNPISGVSYKDRCMDNEACVKIVDIPETLRPLKAICRSVILDSLCDVGDANALPLPSSLQIYIQWK